MNNRPRGRQKNITGMGKNIQRRGSGLGTGPVGKPGRTPRPTMGSNQTSMGGTPTGGSQRRNVTRSGGGLGGKLILILLALLLGGGGGVGSLLLGGDSGYTYEPPAPTA